MNKPIMPATLEPAYSAFMVLPLEERLKQLAADLNRIASNDFKNAEEACEVMRANMWQLEWIGYAQELEVEVMAEAVDLYRFLGRWRNRWDALEADPQQMVMVQNEAREWAKKMLERAERKDF